MEPELDGTRTGWNLTWSRNRRQFDFFKPEPNGIEQNQEIQAFAKRKIRRPGLDLGLHNSRVVDFRSAKLGAYVWPILQKKSTGNHGELEYLMS